MGGNFYSAFATVLFAGLCSGSFSMPFKHNKKWVWENNWLIWSIIALVLAPWIVSIVSIPHLGEVYQSESSCIISVIVFGLIWGIGSITFGMGLDILGVTLAMPLMLGLTNCIGTIAPILIKDPAMLLTEEGLLLLAGVAIIVIGIILYSIAGKYREENERRDKKQFAKGLVICLIAGIFGPMVNIAFVYGDPIAEKALELGANELCAPNAIWSIALTAGFIVNAAYCIFRFRKYGTHSNYCNGNKTNYIFAVLGGLIWFLSIMLYGIGTKIMGPLGTSVGWATMQTVAILTGNFAGIFAGEWKGSPKKSMVMMYIGLAMMIAGVIIIAF